MNDYRLIRYRIRIPDIAIGRDDEGLLENAVRAFVAVVDKSTIYRTEHDRVVHVHGEGIEPDRPSRYERGRPGAAAAAICAVVDKLAPGWRSQQTCRW